MKKLKIVHHSNHLGMGGTEKTMQYLLEYLAAAGHDCWCMYRGSATGNDALRAGAIGELLGRNKVIAYTGAEDFFARLAEINPDIFHAHRSGSPNEFPVVSGLKRHVLKCVETNVFGGYDPSPVIDLTLYNNKRMCSDAKRLPRKQDWLYLPVKSPGHRRDLRGKLGIAPGTFVMGRIGRPDDLIFDPISLKALKFIEDSGAEDIVYLVQSPPPAMVKTASELGLKKVIFLPEPVLSDDSVTEFYNTIDVLAHARRDGETFGLTIAEAMIHGKPVVSHRSLVANAHEDLVRECGYFCDVGDFRGYAGKLLRLYKDKGLRDELGERGRRFAEENLLLEKIGARLENFYAELLSEPLESHAADRGRDMAAFYSSSGTYLETLKGHDNTAYSELLGACVSGFKPGGRVLDCGCGTGSFSRLLAQKGFEVTGADISPIFVEEARKRSAGMPGLKFVVEDMAGMSLPDQSFDGVTSTLFLEHAADVPGSLAEMCRVLKSGGTLLVNLPSFLDPVQHLREFISWKDRPFPRPWEARSRAGALLKFFSASMLVLLKWSGLDKKIYYLDPVLSDKAEECSHDYDAAWLANQFDVRRLLEEAGLTVSVFFPPGPEGPVAKIIGRAGLPDALRTAYAALRASGFIVTAKKP